MSFACKKQLSIWYSLLTSLLISMSSSNMDGTWLEALPLFLFLISILFSGKFSKLLNFASSDTLRDFFLKCFKISAKISLYWMIKNNMMRIKKYRYWKIYKAINNLTNFLQTLLTQSLEVILLVKRKYSILLINFDTGKI